MDNKSAINVNGYILPRWAGENDCTDESDFSLIFLFPLLTGYITQVN